MKPTICPYLGFKEDPETHYAFPSFQNCCRRARPVEPVNLEHQSSHCLGTNYIHCPVLASSLIVPLPDGLRHSVASKNKNVIGISITAVVIVVLVFVGLWQGGNLAKSAASKTKVTEIEPIFTVTPIQPSTDEKVLPNIMTDPRYTPTLLPTGSPTERIQSPSITFTPDVTPADTPADTATMTSIPMATETVCAPPAGWVIYIVQPNDSLFQIGLYFGVTVKALQDANCLGNSVIIFTGQKLYVPNVPTRTPQSPPTRIPTQTPLPTTITPPTETSVPIPTDTPQPTETPLPTTPLPTTTPLSSNTPNPTSTPVPSSTYTPPPTESE